MFSHASSEGAGVVSLLNVSLDVDVNQEIVPIVTILRSQLTNPVQGYNGRGWLRPLNA